MALKVVTPGLLLEELWEPDSLSWFNIFFLPSPSTQLPATAAGLKPLTLGWWGKCSTTLLLMASLVQYIFWNFLLSHFQQQQQDSNHWPWDDEANVLPLYFWGLSGLHIYIIASSCSRTQTLDIGMMRQVYYHCFTPAGVVLYHTTKCD